MNRLLALFRWRRMERELSVELRFHLDQQIEENLAAGMAPGEARSAALRTLGGLAQLEEECRDARGWTPLRDLLRDVRFALRTLRRSPLFTAVSVLTLALGIGANTAIFSIVNGVLLQPLRYPEADRIVALNTHWTDSGHTAPRLSGGDLADLLAQQRTFDALGYYGGGEVGVEVRGRADFAGVQWVNPGFLRVFSLAPARGRLLEPADAGRAAVIGARFATRLFGSAPAALGQALSIEREVYQVTGVLPSGFDFPAHTEIWAAAPARLENLDRTAYNYRAVARLRPDAPLETAQAQLHTFAARLAAAFPASNRAKTIVATPLRDQLVAPVGATLWVLMAAVSLVLLIACANVANLLLARAAGRAREIALRAAMGASRWRILRQLGVESAVLAAAAGVLGLLVAAAGSAALLRLAPDNVPRLSEVRVDGFVLLFTAAVALGATILFGFAPAWRASRVDLHDTLKQGGARGLLGGGAGRLGALLVATEIALSFVLATGAGLLLRSFLALTAVDPGYRTEGILVMYAHEPARGLQEHVRVAAAFTHIAPELAALPGVISVGAAMGVPAGKYGSNGLYAIQGRPAARSVNEMPNAAFLLASPGYFSTLGIPLRRGRDFSVRDRYEAPFVAIVSGALVRQSFPNEEPLGKRIECGLDAPGKWMEIVGVVGDVRQDSPAAPPQPAIYMPLQQHPYFANEYQVVMRTRLAPASLIGPARAKMRILDPTAALSFTTLEQMVAASIATPRFRAFLIGAFAALALALAMAGVYGVMSYLTEQRTSEFGLRLALGAGPRQLLALVVGRAARLAAAGLALGLAISLAAARLVSGMLFGLKPTDTVTYTGVLATLLLVTLAAAALPALRAARTDPSSALRQE